MVSQQSTTIPLDFTHLKPKIHLWNRPTCFTHPVEDDESITNYILNDIENFSKFNYILQHSGLAKMFFENNNYTLAVIPDKFMKDVCTTKLSKFDAFYIIQKHTINNAIRPCDIGDDTLWIQNRHKEFVTLSQKYWNNAKIMGNKKCSNGYIYIVDRIIN